jgi:hypothetical protein
MLPPKPDRADPYGRAPPEAAQVARPDRPRPALPSRHPTRRTEQTWSSADRIQNRKPFSAGRCGRRGPPQVPGAKELRIMCPGTSRIIEIIGQITGTVCRRKP